jgi:hypothetical protein
MSTNRRKVGELPLGAEKDQEMILHNTCVAQLRRRIRALKERKVAYKAKKISHVQAPLKKEESPEGKGLALSDLKEEPGGRDPNAYVIPEVGIEHTVEALFARIDGLQAQVEVLQKEGLKAEADVEHWKGQAYNGYKEDKRGREGEGIGRARERDPPAFGAAGGMTLQLWIQRLEMWRNTGAPRANQQADRVLDKLQGRPLALALSLGNAKLLSDTGLDEIVALFKHTLGEEDSALEFSYFNSIVSLQRAPSQTVQDFLLEFETKVRGYESRGGNIPGHIAGSLLLGKLGLSQAEKAQVYSLLPPGANDAWNISNVVRRLFVDLSASATGKTGLVVETPPTPPPAAYAAINGREQPGGARRLGDWKSCNFCNSNDHKYGEAGPCGDRMKDHLARGYCTLCRKEVGHVSRDCPSKKTKRYPAGNHVPSPQAFISLPGSGGVGAVEYVGARMALAAERGELESLGGECLASGAGVLDSGCSHTVGGQEWLEGYQKIFGLLDTVVGGGTPYSFGKGTPSLTTGRVKVPLRYGDVVRELEVDIVPGPLPLLVSKQDQIALDGVLKAREGTFTVRGGGKETTVPLVNSQGGLWLLPLSWK